MPVKPGRRPTAPGSQKAKVERQKSKVGPSQPQAGSQGGAHGAFGAFGKRPSVAPDGRRRRTAGYFHAVWGVVRRIPPGRVATYGQVAKLAGFPGAARQVVWALRAAPHSAGLPWHRVLGAGGKILLPGPAGMEQRLRLEAEGVTLAGASVRMHRHQWRP